MPDEFLPVPGFWLYETSGVLRPAVEAYLYGSRVAPLAPEHIATLRAYLRQWIASPVWHDADHLRASIDGLTSREAIDQWLDNALAVGIDPL